MRVFVLLFNARTDNEGIHTLKVGDRNVVLMFESEDDATRYGLMLEAQDFPSATVEAFESEDIESFCVDADYEAKIVPDGTLEVPPEASVDSIDWNPDASPDEVKPASAQKDSDAPEFSQDELERIRLKLEGLM
ncbi:MAG: DUF3110 domain-containing protein [Elainellaceae cyanobacterium]